MATLAENRKVRFDFEMLENYEAGIELLGLEVKSIKAHRMSLDGSYVFPMRGEFWLVGANIAPYQPNNTPKDYNQMRERKLLLNKKEINYLIGKKKTKGFSLIPLKIYENNGRIKIEFGLAKGKRKYDKKEKIKKRDIEREINRELSA